LEQFVKTAASAVPPGSRVLDAGAGDCQYKSFFGRMHYESADFCQVDKAYADIKYVCDLTSIPVPCDYYDLVVCTQVLEHVSNPKEVVAELHRVLKPGGFLYLSAPLFYEEHEIPYDFFRYTRFGLQHLLEAGGLELLQLSPLEGYLGTLSYQLDLAGKALSGQFLQFAKSYGLARSILLRALAPFFRALARMFGKMDLGSRLDIGMCKNYTAVARKPLRSP